VPEFRDHAPDRPAPEASDHPSGSDRYADDRRELRAAMDQAVRDPAFALSPQQESELRRSRAMSPADSANYRPGYQMSLDRPLPGPDGPKTPRDSMRDMPGITPDEADRYLATTDVSDRPWLGPAHNASPDAQRVIATVDQGEGHYLQRHEGAASGEAARARVERLHDPANPDAASRIRSDDAFRARSDGSAQRHRCGPETTTIADADAFATAVARAQEHPDVRDTLDRHPRPGYRPRAVHIPIADLLGPEGHKVCEGYHLEPVNGSVHAAQQNRADWVKAQRDGTPTDAIEPRSTKIDTFEGGTMLVAFQPREDGRGYEILTMYPRPRPEENDARG
jgi:hypothetical protein